jgi:hypothetical protein
VNLLVALPNSPLPSRAGCWPQGRQCRALLRGVQALGWDARLIGPRALLNTLPRHDIATLAVPADTRAGEMLLAAEPFVQGEDVCLLIAEPELLGAVVPLTCLFHQLQADVMLTLRAPDACTPGAHEVRLIGDLVVDLPPARDGYSPVQGLYVMSGAIFSALRATRGHSLHAAIRRLTRGNAVFAYQPGPLAASS